MNFRGNRWLLRFAVVIVAGLLALFWAVTHRTYSLTIENRSQQLIDEMSVTIGGQTQTFRNVQTNAKVTAECPARGDDQFTVEGRLADKTRIRANGRAGENLDFILIPGGHLQPRRKDSR